MADAGGKGPWLGAGVVLGALLALCPGVLRGETLFLRDLSVFHRPLRRLLLELISTTDGLPAWNPLSHFGQPFAANPNAAVFDPFSALFLVLPFDLAFNLQVLLPLLVGAAGFAFLVRERGGSGFAATFGALTWGLGGCALSVSSYLQMHHAVAFLPLALALTLRLVREPSPRRVALLALVLGLQGLAGSPTGLMITALLIPFAAWEAWPAGAGRPALHRALLGLVGAAVLGAAVGAATWMPAAALLQDTARVESESFDEEAAGWSLPPVRVLELAAPRLFGHVVPETVGWYWGRGLYGWREWPYLFSIYGGLAGLLFSVTAILARRGRDRPWTVAGGVGLLLSLGAHLPGWDLLLRIVPPLGVVRFPEKWAVAPALVLALLAARGFDLILHDERSRRIGTRLGLGLMAVLGLSAVLMPFSMGGPWEEFWGLPAWLASEAGLRAWKDLALQSALITTLVGVMAIRHRRRRLVPLLLIGFTAVDLVLAGSSLMPTDAPERFDTPPVVLAPLLAAPEGERTLFQYADWKRTETRRDGKQVLLEAPVPWQWGIATAFEKDFDGTHLAWSRAATSELMELMAEDPAFVGPILASRGVNSVLRPAVTGERDDLKLLAVRSPRSFAHSVGEAVVRGDDESLAAATRRARAATILEPGAVVPATLAPAKVRVLAQSPTDLRLAATSEGASLIAINSTWHPGWQVMVDQEPAELLRRDGHLSALLLPPGDHLIRMRFRSPSLSAGVVSSLLGIAATLGLLLRSRRSSLSRREASSAG